MILADFFALTAYIARIKKPPNVNNPKPQQTLQHSFTEDTWMLDNSKGKLKAAFAVESCA